MYLMESSILKKCIPAKNERSAANIGFMQYRQKNIYSAEELLFCFSKGMKLQNLNSRTA
jgi:hypothetical protein